MFIFLEISLEMSSSYIYLYSGFVSWHCLLCLYTRNFYSEVGNAMAHCQKSLGFQLVELLQYHISILLQTLEIFLEVAGMIQWHTVEIYQYLLSIFLEIYSVYLFDDMFQKLPEKCSFGQAILSYQSFRLYYRNSYLQAAGVTV